ncbi:DDB1- and CUL4-associated factor 10 isoform X1 [Vanessa tameamea]|uniref:DDB1- and CUL4-associated factor 10 isoform X1 n=1 Tax=Vanessa tameamea TaxID=334116 RepID=A0ABM4ARU6_VANTA|nr:DDB1- and CUL4-associated factor 10 isoform X1 [Vanessa atalanta]
MGTKTIRDSSFMAKYSAYSPYRLLRRESGFENPVGASDAMARSLYCGMKPIASWDCEQANALPTGGVFNLEFSPEGSLLVAACEKKSIQIFDPLTHQRIHSVNGAHSDCVNCVKFLDGRMFATCSDDTTIALWDVRNLKKKIRSLLGHSNWVKNIEFSVKDKLLVTSGLDGSIYTWDINSYTEFNLVYQRVFHASGLMRCRLSPDARQMVMCTTGGLLVIIHDLNLSTLAQHLHGFKPNLYRLMQMSQQLIPIAAMYDHLFDLKRTENRVEFVSDFPDGNDAEVVSALQIHPQGWCALSRNISHDDRSEWSCIHDIQAGAHAGAEPADKSTRSRSPPRRPAPRRRARPRARPYRQPRPMAAVPPALPASVAPARPSTDSTRRERDRDEEAEPEAGPSAPRLAPGLSSIQNDVWEASITIKQHRMLQEMYSRGQVGRNFNMQRIMGINTGIAPPGVLRARSLRAAPARLLPRLSATPALPARAPPDDSTLPSTSGQTPRRESSSSCEDEETPHYIRQNRDRLLYYVEETNEGKGFIKELCFSADGRLVCSPFGRGMRLLALNDRCAELSHCVQDFDGPTQMVDVGQSLGIHQDLVVSSKFSPRHHLLVTGCLEGKIVWYEPYSGESCY